MAETVAAQRDKAISHEEAEVAKLEKFIQEERLRSHVVATTLHAKQEEANERRRAVALARKQHQAGLKARNAELQARAGKKAEDLAQGNMAGYEAKQAMIMQKE